MAQAGVDDSDIWNMETDTSYASLDQRLESLDVRQIGDFRDLNFEDGADLWFRPTHHQRQEDDDAATVRRVATNALVPKKLVERQQVATGQSSETTASMIAKSKPKPKYFSGVGESLRNRIKSVHLTAGLGNEDKTNVQPEEAISVPADILPLVKNPTDSAASPAIPINLNRPDGSNLKAPTLTSSQPLQEPSVVGKKRVVRINGKDITKTAMMQRRGHVKSQPPPPPPHPACLEVPAAATSSALPADVHAPPVKVSEVHKPNTGTGDANNHKKSPCLPTPSASSSGGSSPKHDSATDDEEPVPVRSANDAIYWRQKQWLEKREQRLRNTEKQADEANKRGKRNVVDGRSRKRDVAPAAARTDVVSRVQQHRKQPAMAFGRPLSSERHRSRSISIHAAIKSAAAPAELNLPLQPLAAPAKRICTVPVGFKFTARERKKTEAPTHSKVSEQHKRSKAVRFRPKPKPAIKARPVAADKLVVSKAAATVFLPFKFATDTRIEEWHKKHHDEVATVSVTAPSSKPPVPAPVLQNKLLQKVKSSKPLTKPYSPKFLIEKRLRDKRQAADEKKAHKVDAANDLVSHAGRSTSCRSRQQNVRPISRRSRSACGIVPKKIILPAAVERPLTSAANMAPNAPSSAGDGSAAVAVSSINPSRGHHNIVNLMDDDLI